MKDRDITIIMRIAEKVKASIEEFRPKVPLLVALKKVGMRERHWELIERVVGYRVNPYDNKDFCFQTILDLGLL